MSKMMGKAKHMGRWFIDSREDNRAARSRERAAWKAQEGREWDCGLMDDPEDPHEPVGPETGAGDR